MTQVSYIATEFPDELLTIQRLRLENSVFTEICDDLELMGRDLATFSEAEHLGNQSAYPDILDSIQGLHEEIVEFLHRNVKPAVGEM